MTRSGRVVVVPVLLAFALPTAALACSEVAKLDLAYAADGGTDASAADRQKVRPSTIEATDAAPSATTPPSDLGGCDGGLGEGAGCDDTAGLGCCLSATGSQCIEQREVATRCAAPAAVFIACRQGTGDSACCWRANGSARIAAFAASCDEGATACLDSLGCPEGLTCQTRDCAVGGTTFTVGACGTAPACPGESAP